MLRFRPGQKVRIKPDPGIPAYLSDFIGKTTTVLTHPIPFPHDKLTLGYGISFRFEGTHLIASGEVLEPLYDGDCPSTWDECLWKPKEVTK
jgi:hypothetical protein